LNSPDLTHLEPLLGDLAFEGEIARTAGAVIHGVRLGRLGDRPLALKVALRSSADDELARFRHEARLLSEVRHPNVIEVHEVGVLPGGFPFLVMERVEPYRPPQRPGWEEVYDLAIQAAAGLAHIHHHRVVHLDVKPGNLGTAPSPAAGPAGSGRLLKILDFGLAQELRGPLGELGTLERSIRGTLAYTAPEVLLQDRYDHRADLYSLGLTLLEIATGTLPSAGGDRAALRYHLTGETPHPRALRSDLPVALAEVLERLLRRDPGERFANAGRLLEALGRAAGRSIDPGALALGAGGVLACRPVGRREVVERLSGELAAVRRGESRAVCLVGPEGAGKSRLLRELRLLGAVEGARVAYGRVNSEGSRPFQPFLQVLDQLGIAVEPPGSTGADPEAARPAADLPGRFLLFRDVSRKLAAAARTRGGGAEAPLVLLLDDLHLAGRESRELLDFLAADLAPAPILIVASRRPDEAGGEPVAALRSADDGPGVAVLDLAPLTREDSVELVEACLGVEQPGSLPGRLHAWIHEASAGIPGRVHQLLGHLIEEGDLVFRGGEWKPRRAALARLTGREAAEALAWRRLGSLEASARGLLEGAAVIGVPFRASALAELLGEPIEDVWAGLSGLADKGFLERLAEPEGTAYAIAGSRLRDGLYATLEAGRRARLHRRLGELLARRVDAGARELTADAAEHLWRAGHRGESLPYLLEAARQAGAIHGHAEAAALFGRAAEAAEEAGDAERAFEARAGEARESSLGGHPGRALRGYRRLLDAGATPGSPGAAGGGLARARLTLEKGRLHGRLGEHPAALAAFEEGLEALAGGATREEPEPSRGGLELAIELLHGKAVALRDLGRAEEAIETARGALRQCRPDGTGGLARQRALLVNTLAMTAFARGDWPRARRLARWGLRGAERSGEVYHALLLRNTLAMARWKTGDFDGASALYDQNLAAADELNDPWAQLTAINNLAVLRCGRGDWSQARRLLSRSFEMNRRLGAREGEARARINLGEVEEILGDRRRARRHAERAIALLDGPAESADRVAARLLLASLARKTGALDEAAGLLREAAAGAEAVGDRDLRLQALLERGLLEADRGDLVQAAKDLDLALQGAREAGTGELLGRVLLARAGLALARGDSEAAAREARAARELARELGDRLSEARALVLEARQSSSRGAAGADPGDPALDLLERALETFEELGAETDAEAARGAIAALRERGGRDTTLPEVMRVINSSLDLGEVLDRTMDLALERLGAERGMVVLADRLTGGLEVAVARNLGRDGDGAEEHKLSESVVRRVIETDEPVLAVDAPADRRFAGAESIVASHILSILCVPLSIRDRPAGAIYVDHCKSRHLFGPTDLAFLRAFADGAAVAIDNARLFGELEEARRRLKAENESLRREVFAVHHLGSLIGRSRAIEELKATLERVAQSSSTVLIRGESGTGKGLVARIIHNVSPRREGPFVHFNCAALPESLVESELFGHEKGAFTGATERKPGRFELADGGTVFLDEVGKVSRAVQAKLLRVVEDKEFERVGGTRTLRSDVRIITATNLDLEAAIARDEFREDLYYRLNIIPIVLPPLRERREDLPYLVRHFLERIGADLGQGTRDLDPAVLELFARHRWPGNVRELESAIHRALVLSPREVLTPADFAWIAASNASGAELAAAAGASAAAMELEAGVYQGLLDGFDRRLLETAIARCDGKIRETARFLGIARNTLKSKMKRYGLEG
jgi:Nif-specific regulatory protein